MSSSSVVESMSADEIAEHIKKQNWPPALKNGVKMLYQAYVEHHAQGYKTGHPGYKRKIRFKKQLAGFGIYV